MTIEQKAELFDWLLTHASNVKLNFPSGTSLKLYADVNGGLVGQLLKYRTIENGLPTFHQAENNFLQEEKSH